MSFIFSCDICNASSFSSNANKTLWCSDCTIFWYWFFSVSVWTSCCWVSFNSFVTFSNELVVSSNFIHKIFWVHRVKQLFTVFEWKRCVRRVKRVINVLTRLLIFLLCIRHDHARFMILCVLEVKKEAQIMAIWRVLSLLKCTHKYQCCHMARILVFDVRVIASHIDCIVLLKICLWRQ